MVETLADALFCMPAVDLNSILPHRMPATDDIMIIGIRMICAQDTQ